MQKQHSLIVKVAIAVPLDTLFDYKTKQPIAIGSRVLVNFGRRRVVAVVIKQATTSTIDDAKLKYISRVLDQKPSLGANLLELAQRGSAYYHHPIGEVVHSFLPPFLSKIKPSSNRELKYWQLSAKGRQLLPDELKNAPLQQQILAFFKRSAQPLNQQQLNAEFKNWHSSLRSLLAKDILRQLERPPSEKLPLKTTAALNSQLKSQALDLNQQQRAAVTAILNRSGFAPFLLNGITGSGKTEVYLQVAADFLRRQLQVLVLVPEIGLTPQLLGRFKQRFNCQIVCMHSQINSSERQTAWQQAADNKAQIVIGTRLAVFTPMPSLGLIIIDEEHDASFKQQDGFRYHARDMAMLRAKSEQLCIVLGSATPAFETYLNAQNKRYQELKLTKIATAAAANLIQVVDKSKVYQSAFCPTSIAAMQKVLARGRQVLVFLNRRGFAPILSCPSCNWVSSCNRCDANMTVHLQPQGLFCHHCSKTDQLYKACPQCGFGHLETTGMGTEQLEKQLAKYFATRRILRIDKDSTKGKNQLEKKLQQASKGEADILIGTQMLAKGHHFPKLALACIVDADRGLFSADFRGAEQMGQLIMQVAGRAGREKQGQVIIQTSHPEHQVFKILLSSGYAAFTEYCLSERKTMHLPPYAHLALLRSESVKAELALDYLQEIGSKLAAQNLQVEVLGPVPAPMERIRGKFRAQLLIRATHRRHRHRALLALSKIQKSSKSLPKVRYSLDVDPLDML